MTGVASYESTESIEEQDHAKAGATFRRLVGLGCSVAALVLHLNVTTTSQSAALALGLSILGGLIVAWRSDRGVGGAAFVYLLVFGLFHAGLVVAVVLGGEQMLIGQGLNNWVFSSAISAAVLAVCISIIAWECGVLVSRPDAASSHRLDQKSKSRTDIVGFVGVIAGLTLIALALAPHGGFGALFSGYLQFLEKVANDSEFGYGVAILGCGVGFLVASGGRARLWGWGVAAGLAAVGLPLGLRGTVLFLLATVLVVEAKRTRISAWLFAASSLVVLTLVSVLRSTRVGGIEALLAGGFKTPSPLEAIAEMGYSLYPVVVVQKWIEGGFEYRNGVTFVAPILRFFENLFGSDPGPGQEDLRIFNVEIFIREGPIGGSPVAEALRNGGTLGVIILMLVIGYVVGRVDRLPATADGGAITVVVLLPLLIAVRNSFAPVLVQIGIGVGMLVIARLLGRALEERGSP